jgi:PilZ domain-containing protein
VSVGQPLPAPPVAYDVVQIIDQSTATRLNAIVRSVDADQYVLHLEQPGSVPREAPVRWFDGHTAWQAVSKLERIDETSVNCQLAPAPEWEAAPVRQSLRAPVDNAPILARVSQQGQTRGRLVHAVCLDVSASGCRVSWPGSTPGVGHRVELAWDIGDWQSASQPDWIPARVARIVPMPFGTRQVGFAFEMLDADQVSRVRAWYHSWLEQHRQRARRRPPHSAIPPPVG